jgi:hypothetical protein
VEGELPRYIVERTFPDGGFGFGANAAGASACQSVVERNAELGVTWLCSYVTLDRSKTFDVYDAESPEAVRKTARRNELPVDCITQVEVLDPYFCR